MIRVFGGALLLASTVLGWPIAASGVSPIDADVAVREALAGNRDLQAALLAIDVARGRLVQSGRLSNPEIGVAGFDDFAFQDEGERSQSVVLAQSFPVTSRLARERDVARSDVAIAEAEVREFVRALIADTLGAFYMLRGLDRQIEVNRELVDSFRQVEQTLTRRLRAAELSPAEVSLVRIERLTLEQEARRLRMERDTMNGRLARLLGRSPGGLIRPVGDLDPGAKIPLDDRSLVEEATRQRTDLVSARREIERAEADRALAGAEVWQDVTIEVSYDRERQVFDDPIGTKSDTFLGVGVTVPLPLWNRQQGRIAAAAAEQRRARRAADALSLRVDEEVRAAVARVKALRLGVDEYEKALIPEAKRTRSLFEQGYERGLVGIAELIQALRQDSEAQASYLELLSDLRQASIDLEAAIGGSPYLEEIFPPRGTP